MIPSFFSLLEEGRYPLDGWNEVLKYNSKLAGRVLAESLGVPTHRLFQVGKMADLVPPDEPFVLKPNSGSSSIGVFPLIPRDDGTYVDAWNGKRGRWGYWMKRAYEAKRPNIAPLWDQPSHPWLIEEYRPAIEYKVYAFHGEVGFVMQYRRVRRGRYVIKYWSPDWEHIGDISQKWPYDSTLPPPENGDVILENAAKVSAALPAPFARVDMYEGGIFGEITPRPGGKTRYVDEWDQRLGEMWVRAEQRLRAA